MIKIGSRAYLQLTIRTVGFLQEARLAVVSSVVLCTLGLLDLSLTRTMAQDAAQQAALQQHARVAGEAMQRLDYATAEREYLAILTLAPKVAEVRSNLGLAYYLQGKYDPAAEQFQQTLKLKPSLYAPNYFLARVRYQQGRFREALPLLQHALELEPENIEARRQLASTHLALKEFPRAIELYRSCLTKDPRNMETLYDLGIVHMNLAQRAFDRVADLPASAFSSLIKASHYVKAADWGQAEQGEWTQFSRSEYLLAIEKAPRLPELRARLGDLELTAGNWEVAAQLFDKELELDPFSYQVRYGLAQVSFHRKNLEMTLTHLNEAARIRPEFFDPLPAFRMSLAREELIALNSKIRENGVDKGFGGAFLQAKVAAELGNTVDETAALRVSEKMLADIRSRLCAVSTELQKSKEQAEQRGLQLVRQKRYEAGTGLLLPLARKTDVVPEVLLAAARASISLKEYDVASEILDSYSRRHPDDPEPHYLLGLSHQNAAMEIMSVMVDTDPLSYRLRQLVGDAYFAQERYQDAVAEYEAALHAQPGNSDMFFKLGKAYHRQMKYAEALEYFRQSVESNPRNVTAQLSLGDSLLLVRKPEEAIPHLRAALDLDSSLIDAHAKLGKAWAMLDRFKDAARELELASGLDQDGSIHYQLSVYYRRLGQEERAAAAANESQRLRAQQLKKQELQTMKQQEGGAGNAEEVRR